MRVVIGGCRDYNDYNSFTSYLYKYLSAYDDSITIVSGHCSGVDTMAERFAHENSFSLEIIPAEWKKYGKAAGPIRNETMVKNSDAIIAFWDNKSKGTKNLISLAKKYNKIITIIQI